MNGLGFRSMGAGAKELESRKEVSGNTTPCRMTGVTLHGVAFQKVEGLGIPAGPLRPISRCIPRVQGSGFRVYGVGCRVQGSGFRV